MEWLSSIVQDAKEQIDEIIHTIADEEFLNGAQQRETLNDETNANHEIGIQNEKLDDDDEQVEFSRPSGGVQQQQPTTSGVEQPVLDSEIGNGSEQQIPPAKHKVDNKKSICPDELDASVPHDSFNFMSGLLQRPQEARKLFTSYYSLHKEEIQRFVISPAQITHAKSIIRALPAFDRLRFELCPSVLPDKHFWAIYFAIIRDKRTLGAPKDILSRDVATTTRNTDSTQKPSQEKVQNQHSLGDEVAFVSDLLFSGARQTLRLAETFIETVDRTIANSVSPREGGANLQGESDSKATFEDRGLKSPSNAEQDKKRARYVSTNTNEPVHSTTSTKQDHSHAKLPSNDTRGPPEPVHSSKGSSPVPTPQATSTNSKLTTGPASRDKQCGQAKNESSTQVQTRQIELPGNNGESKTPTIGGKQLNWSYVPKTLDTDKLSNDSTADEGEYSDISSCDGSICDDNLVIVSSKGMHMEELEYLPSDEEEYEFV